MNYDELAFQISACNRRRIYQLEEIDRQVATALASVDKRIEGLSSSSGNISNQVQQNTQNISANANDISILDQNQRQAATDLAALKKSLESLRTILREEIQEARNESQGRDDIAQQILRHVSLALASVKKSVELNRVPDIPNTVNKEVTFNANVGFGVSNPSFSVDVDGDVYLQEAVDFEHIFPKDDGNTDTFTGTDETDNHGIRVRPTSGVGGGGIQLMFGTDSSQNISYCKTYRGGFSFPIVFDNPLFIGDPNPPQFANLSVSGNTALEALRAGPWLIDGRNNGFDNNFAQLAHHDRFNDQDYCILHETTGRTVINCASGTKMEFRQDNVDMVDADSSSWKFLQTIDMQSTGNVESVNNLNVKSINSNNGNNPINVTQTMDFSGFDNPGKSARFFNQVLVEDSQLLIDSKNNSNNGLRCIGNADIQLDASSNISFFDSNSSIGDNNIANDLIIESEGDQVKIIGNSNSTNGYARFQANILGGNEGIEVGNDRGSFFIFQQDDVNNVTEVNDQNDNNNSTFDVKGTKNFKVQDKENGRLIRHSCVESNLGTQCLYRFDVETKNGKAKVSLPDYFSWLNFDDAHVYCQADEHFGMAYGKIHRMNASKPKPGKPGGRLSIFSNQDGPYQVMVIASRDVEFCDTCKPENGEFGPNPGKKRKPKAQGKRKKPG